MRKRAAQRVGRRVPQDAPHELSVVVAKHLRDVKQHLDETLGVQRSLSIPGKIPHGIWARSSARVRMGQELRSMRAEVSLMRHRADIRAQNLRNILAEKQQRRRERFAESSQRFQRTHTFSLHGSQENSNSEAWHSSNRSTSRRIALTSLLEDTFAEDHPPSDMLTSDELRSLNSALCSSRSSGNQKCCICLENVAGRPITVLTCAHKFHTNCIKSWLCRANSCPLCMRPVVERRPK